MEMEWERLIPLVFCCYFAVSLLFGLTFWYLTVFCEEASHLYGDMAPGYSLAETCFWYVPMRFVNLPYYRQTYNTELHNVNIHSLQWHAPAPAWYISALSMYDKVA